MHSVFMDRSVETLFCVLGKAAGKLHWSKIERNSPKTLKKYEKSACIIRISMLFFKGCGMIAMKREVAARYVAGFPWSECQVRKLATSHCTKLNICSYRQKQRVVGRDTHGNVYSHRLSYFVKCEKEATFFMASQVMRITLKAYDHQLVDQSAGIIIETVKKTGSQVSGPVPLPTKKEVVTILRAVHKYKDSREQFEQRTHKRLIDIISPSQKTVDALSKLEMPAGVYIDIKMKNKG